MHLLVATTHICLASGSSGQGITGTYHSPGLIAQSSGSFIEDLMVMFIEGIFTLMINLNPIAAAFEVLRRSRLRAIPLAGARS